MHWIEWPATETPAHHELSLARGLAQRQYLSLIELGDTARAERDPMISPGRLCRARCSVNEQTSKRADEQASEQASQPAKQVSLLLGLSAEVFQLWDVSARTKSVGTFAGRELKAQQSRSSSAQHIYSVNRSTERGAVPL